VNGPRLASGGQPAIVAALEADEQERALELVLAQAEAGRAEQRERMRELAVACLPSSAPNTHSRRGIGGALQPWSTDVRKSAGRR
jgi:hypothetical protein